GRVPRGQIDMVSVILHELGHGLGFLSSANVNDDDLGELGFGTQFIIFDTFIETRAGNRITDRSQFSNPSTSLRTAYTSNGLFFADNFVASFNNSNDPKLHAPRSFDQGSSISHLDEFAFNSGSENALMSPSLSFQEAIHDPGPVGLAIMEALGWEVFSGVVTSTQELITEALEVYPNPARTTIQIKWPSDLDSQVNYQLLDPLGRTLQNGSIFRQETLDVSQLTAGTYFLQLQAGARTFVSTIVIVD
ncbi:MAG: T9SS type A sorting domain-containing protein, partial [Bacteroidota bacterium]